MSDTAHHQAEIVERRFTGPLAERLVADSGAEIVLHWLGQAGFVIQAGRQRILIDPYLSDALGEKCRGTATPHERLSPAPIDVEGLGAIDLVLVTHHHTDHMDPGALAPLARRNPALRIVAPRASRTDIVSRANIGVERLILLDAGERAEVLPGLSVVAVRAAHETLERDAQGHHRFLGYAMIFDTATILHTGDTIPFDGQVEEVGRLRPDLLLLPVNGRSAALAARNIPGNMTLDEAVRLTADSGVPVMVAHHHGLFAFNTLPLAEIEDKAAAPGLPIRLIPAREGLEVSVRPT